MSITLDHLHFHLHQFIFPEHHIFLRARSTVSNFLEFEDYVMFELRVLIKLVVSTLISISNFLLSQSRDFLVAKLESYSVLGIFCWD